MRRLIASFVAALSLAAVPALALAAPSSGHDDCMKKCDCARNAKASSTTPSQEPSDWVKSIWSAP
jgi:hypothetical protein